MLTLEERLEILERENKQLTNKFNKLEQDIQEQKNEMQQINKIQLKVNQLQKSIDDIDIMIEDLHNYIDYMNNLLEHNEELYLEVINDNKMLFTGLLNFKKEFTDYIYANCKEQILNGANLIALQLDIFSSGIIDIKSFLEHRKSIILQILQAYQDMDVQMDIDPDELNINISDTGEIKFPMQIGIINNNSKKKHKKNKKNMKAIKTNINVSNKTQNIINFNEVLNKKTNIHTNIKFKKTNTNNVKKNHSVPISPHTSSNTSANTSVPATALEKSFVPSASSTSSTSSVKDIPDSIFDVTSMNALSWFINNSTGAETKVAEEAKTKAEAETVKTKVAMVIDKNIDTKIDKIDEIGIKSKPKSGFKTKTKSKTKANIENGSMAEADIAEKDLKISDKATIINDIVIESIKKNSNKSKGKTKKSLMDESESNTFYEIFNQKLQKKLKNEANFTVTSNSSEDSDKLDFPNTIDMLKASTISNSSKETEEKPNEKNK